MSVVLAGGGTAGHIEPALALADALRRADPQLSIVCLGTERGLETRLVPLRGYELALIPPVPLPRQLTPQLLGVPGRLSAVGERRGAGAGPGRARTCSSGSAATWPRRATWPRGAATCRSWCTRPTPGPGWPTGSAPGSPRTCSPASPTPSSRTPRYIGIPLRHEIASLDRLALADKARAHFGLRPDLPVLLVTGGSQGARSLNYAVLDAADSIRAAGVQVLHILGPRSDLDVRLPAGRPAVRHAAVRGPDGPGLRGGRLRDLPQRRDDLRGTHRGGPARGLCAAAARQRRAAAERGADRGGRRRAHRRRRGPDPGVDPLRPAAHPGQRAARGGHVAGGGGDGPPRHRRQAGRRGPGHHRGPGPGPARAAGAGRATPVAVTPAEGTQRPGGTPAAVRCGGRGRRRA